MASVSAAIPENRLISARPAFMAFVTDSDSQGVIRRALPDLAAEPDGLRRGNIAKAIEHLADHRSPELLIVDISGVELPLSQIRLLSEVCEPGVPVVVIGDRNEIGLYRDLVQLGVSDYIVKPLTIELVSRAVEVARHSFTGAPLAQKLGKVIAVTGTRGGVGTTTVATNLAWYLANRGGRRVALIDFDLQTGDCSLILDLQPTSALREALENPNRIDSLYLERVMVPHGDRLFVLSAEESLSDELRFTPDSVEKLITSLRSDFHYVVLDIPRTPSGAIQRAIDLAALRVIVSDTTIRSAREIARMRSVLNHARGSERNFLVVNRNGERRPGHVPLSEFMSTVEMPAIATIPLVTRLPSGQAADGIPQAAQRGPIAQAVEVLAGEISGRPVARKKWWWPWQ